MTEHERQEHLAQSAADRAVERVFSLLFGVDLKNQEQLNEFRSDLSYMRKLRKLSEKAGVTTVVVFVTVLVTGVIGVLWSGVIRIVRGQTG